VLENFVESTGTRFGTQKEPHAFSIIKCITGCNAYLKLLTLSGSKLHFWNKFIVKKKFFSVGDIN
jgi:hypothetical protein